LKRLNISFFKIQEKGLSQQNLTRRWEDWLRKRKFETRLHKKKWKLWKISIFSQKEFLLKRKNKNY